MPTPPATKAESEELAKQLYDMLMMEIEPDLMLESIPHLDEKYKGETEKERAARMKRYEKAYAEFDKRFAEFMGEVTEKVRTSRREALKEKEEVARREEEEALSELESVFT